MSLDLVLDFVTGALAALIVCGTIITAMWLLSKGRWK